MFDTIYLHAGLPKTGSTHVQNGMQFLSMQGLLGHIAYPVVSPDLGSGNGVRTAGILLGPEADEYLRSGLDECIGDLLDASRVDAGTLLISSEHFFFATVEAFTCFREKLQAHARSVKLLVCVRPLRDWSYSLYMQMVKAHSLCREFDREWLEECGQTYLPYFRNLDRFGLDAVVFRYQDPGLLPLFLRLIGGDERLAAQFPEVRINRSLTIDELEVVRKINSVFHDDVLCRAISDRFTQTWPEYASAKFPPAAEEHFRQFASDYEGLLDPLRSELMRQVKDILFAPADARPAAIAEQASGAPRDLFDIALREIKSLQGQFQPDGQQCQAMKQFSKRMQPTNDFFDPIHYLLMYPDLAVPDVDPEVHYRNHGRAEGRASGLTARHLLRK